jgi:prepilin-type processing-associated H-X9-DG protein
MLYEFDVLRTSDVWCYEIEAPSLKDAIGAVNTGAKPIVRSDLKGYLKRYHANRLNVAFVDKVDCGLVVDRGGVLVIVEEWSESIL